MISFLVNAALLGAALAAPASIFPLPDGFPNPNSQQLASIEQLALGTLPNGAAPPAGAINADGITTLQLINLNENFEVAFFDVLIQNITNNVSGYQISDATERAFVLSALQAVLAQEKLHALNAAGALKSQGKDPIQPCIYQFPVTNFTQAIALANTFTDVVLGTLQDAILHFAAADIVGLTGAIGSVIGNEAEQNGFYRVLQAKVPSAQPFLTASIRDFAFTALQSFSLPGSCPNINEIQLTTYAPLNVLTQNIQAQDQNLQFGFDTNTLKSSTVPNATSYANYNWNNAALVYINQQNVPVVEKLQNIQTSGTYVTFEATFPYSEFLLNGLTIAAVTINQGPFASNAAVADAALFAPGLIELN